MADEIKKDVESKEIIEEVKPIEKSETEILKEKLSAIEKEKELLQKEKEEILKQKELEKLPENEKKRQKEIEELAKQKVNEILKDDLISVLSKDKDFLEFTKDDEDDLKGYSLETLRKKEKKYKEHLLNLSKKQKDEKPKPKDTPSPIGDVIQGQRKNNNGWIKSGDKKW